MVKSTGNPNGNNGALEKIRNGNDQAAIAFLGQAISWLERAQADGATDPQIATRIALGTGRGLVVRRVKPLCRLFPINLD